MLHFFSDKAKSLYKRIPHPTQETSKRQGLAYIFLDICVFTVTAIKLMKQTADAKLFSSFEEEKIIGSTQQKIINCIFSQSNI